MRLCFAAALGMAMLLFAAVIQPVAAHEGHEHGNPPLPAATSAPARAGAASAAFELVAVINGEELLIYLDRFATNEPVEDAAIEVETPTGTVTAKATAGEPYRLPAPWAITANSINLIFTITANGTVDVIPLTLPSSQHVEGNNLSPKTEIHEKTYAPLLSLIGAGLVGLFSGVTLMALIRRKNNLLIIIVLIISCTLMLMSAPSFAHGGEDHGSPEKPASGQGGELAQRLANGNIGAPKSVQRIFAIRTLVTAYSEQRRVFELPGRIIPDPNASGYVQSAVGGRLSFPPGGFPRLGVPVKAGDVLAYVTPPLQAIDISDMRQRQGELDQQISIVERRLARYGVLAPSGAVARTQVEDTRTELQGLKARRALLDQIRREPEALTAPVSGVIADSNAVAGQIAQPNTIIFQIVDPGKLWVEALSFEAITGTEGASAITDSGRNLALAYRGSGLADRNRAIPIHFAIEGNLQGLRVGQLLTVLLGVEEKKKGIALPRSSLVRAANGQDVVFEHASEEIFIAHPVRVEPLDGDRVLAVGGLEEGQRIVTQGADLLDQVR